MKSYAKVSVLKCEPKLNRETQQQEIDKTTLKQLWTVSVKEEVWNEEFGAKETNFVKYKSIVDLDAGEQFVELRHSTMGEGSGSFIKVNHFFTITRVFDPKTTIEQLLAVTSDNVIGNKKTAIKPRPTAQ